MATPLGRLWPHRAAVAPFRLSRLGRSAAVPSPASWSAGLPGGRRCFGATSSSAAAKKGRNPMDISDQPITWTDDSILSVDSKTNKHLMTFVPPPLSKHVSTPLLWFRLLGARLAIRWMDFIGRLTTRLQSMPGTGWRPRYKPNRRALVPTAKALHRTLSEALARGDLTALRKLAMPALYRKLGTVVQQRPRRRRFEWHLVRYTARPRLLQDSLEKIPVSVTLSMYMTTRQVVVAIASRQRLVEYDDANGGVVVSEKEVDLVERLVMMSLVNPHTWALGPWKVWGFAEETTWEQYTTAMDVYRRTERAQVKRAAQKLKKAIS